jgi:PBS lyase HEAT-like repeat
MIEPGPKSCPPNEIVDLVARWHSCPWYNAVELVGNLRVGEASSALVPWINWRSEGPFGMSLEARLIFYPAAKALYEIGDPAIPALQRVLNSGSSGEHARAVRVLCIIHTPKSKAVLQDDLPLETDPDQQTMIKNCLR